MEEVTLPANKNYFLQLTQKHIKLSAPKQSVNTIFAPKGYSIGGYTSLSISNGQYIEIDLDHNTKTWNIINGVPPHNSLTGLQGGKPGEYYHLTKAQWTALTGNNTVGTGIETVLTGVNLAVGDNAITHNLGAIPRVIAFWINGIQVTFAPNLNFYSSPLTNFNVNVSKAQSNVSIYIRALGTS